MLVVVAMSGGVDSAVAAALLQAEGHEVIGVTMQIWPEEDAERTARRGGCCAMGAVRDARAVATLLGIPYYVFDMREEFHAQVIASFAAAYAAGRTPNPCVACNEHIKFRALLAKARRLGAQALATGHYARLVRVGGGEEDWRLCRAVDPRKDQSYVLYPLRREDLPQLRFPLGGLRKTETREIARRLGLPVADKPDSQEICFVGPEGYAAVVGARHPEALRPGPILDLDGRVVGQHRGLAHYTVGQRRGLGLAGSGEPWFVVALDPERNAVVVGRAADAYAEACLVRKANWLVPRPPRAGQPCTAKVRSGPVEHPATVEPTEDGEGVWVRFAEPVRAVTPGQACVLYDGEVVLGGGEITEVRRAGRPAVAQALAAGR
jgi:tRNA-specific 2-thiouridylase